MRRAVLVVLAVVLSAPAAKVWAQETPSPTPSETPAEEEEGCQIGQICTNIDFNPDEQRGPVRDPAGSYVRSLISMGAIALIVGSYLFFAMGWGRLFSRFRRGTERP